MPIRTERVEFNGAHGLKLAARLDRPATPPRAYALFAHCFTCSKDIFAASRIAQALAGCGIATLRFDFEDADDYDAWGATRTPKLSRAVGDSTPTISGKHHDFAGENIERPARSCR